MFTTTHDGGVRDGYTLRLANKWSDARKFAISVEGLKDVSLKSNQAEVSVDGKMISKSIRMPNQEIDLFVTAPGASLDGPSTVISFHATDVTTGEVTTAGDHLPRPDDRLRQCLAVHRLR